MITAPRHGGLWLFVAVALVTVIAQQWPQLFQFERQAILNGEYWRLLSCHFVHLDAKHQWLNVIGLALICCAFPALHSPRTLLLGLLSCATAVSLALLIFMPELSWYAGMSGLLHGLIGIGLVAEIRRGRHYYAIGLVVLAGKLLLEQFTPAVISTSALIDAAVITQAHLAGAAAGLITALLLPVAVPAVQGQLRLFCH